MYLSQNECYTTAGQYCACIEFRLDEQRRHGFHTGQLTDYTLEPNPDAETDQDAPPQKLALAFSTADVVILGWRLGRLTDLIRENKLATVRAVPTQYVNVEPKKPFVSSIIITPIGETRRKEDCVR